MREADRLGFPGAQKFPQQIVLSDLEYAGLCEELGLSEGKMNVWDFEKLMRNQLKHYTQSRLSSMSEFWNISDKDFTTIGTLKHILLEQINIKDRLDSLAHGPTLASDRGMRGRPASLLLNSEEGLANGSDTDSEWMTRANSLMELHRTQVQEMVRDLLSSRQDTESPNKALMSSRAGLKSGRAPKTPKTTTNQSKRNEGEKNGLDAMDEGTDGVPASSEIVQPKSTKGARQSQTPYSQGARSKSRSHSPKKKRGTAPMDGQNLFTSDRGRRMSRDVPPIHVGVEALDGNGEDNLGELYLNDQAETADDKQPSGTVETGSNGLSGSGVTGDGGGVDAGADDTEMPMTDVKTPVPGRSQMAKKARRTVPGGGIRSTPRSPTSAALTSRVNFTDVEGSAGTKSSTDSNNLSGHLAYSVHDKPKTPRSP